MSLIFLHVIVRQLRYVIIIVIEQFSYISGISKLQL